MENLGACFLRSAQQALPDRIGRADFNAFAAMDAFQLVNDRQVVLDDNGVNRADTHTAPAGNTAGRASLSHDFGGPMIGAGDIGCQLMLGNHVDDVLGAGIDALAAGRTVFMVDMSDAIFQIERVEFANRDTVPESEAAEGTGVGAREKPGRFGAVHGAGIFVPLMRIPGRTLAKDIGDQGDDHSRLDAHDLCNGRGGVLASRRAKGGQGFGAVGQRRRIGGTAAVAAASAGSKPAIDDLR